LPCNTEFGEAHYQDQEGEACELDSLHSSRESAQWHNAYSGDTDRPSPILQTTAYGTIRDLPPQETFMCPIST